MILLKNLKKSFAVIFFLGLAFFCFGCDDDSTSEKTGPYNGTWVLDELTDDIGDEYRRQTITITNDQVVFQKEYYRTGIPVYQTAEWTFTYTLGDVLSEGHEIDLVTVSAEETLLAQSFVDECNNYGDCVDGETGITDWVLNQPKDTTGYVWDNWYDIIKIEDSILFIGDGEGNKWYADATTGTSDPLRFTSFDENREFEKQ